MRRHLYNSQWHPHRSDSNNATDSYFFTLLHSLFDPICYIGWLPSQPSAQIFACLYFLLVFAFIRMSIFAESEVADRNPRVPHNIPKVGNDFFPHSLRFIGYHRWDICKGNQYSFKTLPAQTPWKWARAEKSGISTLSEYTWAQLPYTAVL